uniref:Uncharacterized protein n=1 Tax=Arundo donax TaxID=35708 RepID=A0A0A8ZPK5_ARUDO
MTASNASGNLYNQTNSTKCFRLLLIKQSYHFL